MYNHTHQISTEFLINEEIFSFNFSICYPFLCLLLPIIRLRIPQKGFLSWMFLKIKTLIHNFRWIVLDNAYSIVTFAFFIILNSLVPLLARRFYRKTTQTARNSNNWPSVEGEIVSSSIGTRKGGEGGIYYEPLITYSYNVEGRDYQGNRVFIGHDLAYDFGKKWTEEKVSNYPIGTNMAVYYDPDSPELAVLEPGMNPQIRRLRTGLIAVSCFGMLFMLSISFVLAVIFSSIILSF